MTPPPLYYGKTVENKDNNAICERITSTVGFSRIASAVTPRNASAQKQASGLGWAGRGAKALREPR